MICNDELCFVHVPKAAGMSLSKFLLKNLKKRPVHYFLPNGHLSDEEKKIEDVIVHQGTRHENLIEAQQYLKNIGKSLEDFKVIFAVIRNPYDLEVSRFKYLQIGHPWDSGRDAKLAQTGDFKLFAKKSLFWGKKTSEFEKYYTLNGMCLSNMKILRFEDLSHQINIHLSEYVGNTQELGKVNSTKRGDYRKYISQDIEEYIYKRYQWIFDYGFYPREYF